MKKILTFSPVAFTAIVFSAAFISTEVSGQETQKPAVSPQPVQVAAPPMKQQNNQQNAATAKPNNAANAPKTTDKKTTAKPPVDNKIAVSDPGIPSEKTSKKSTAAPTDNKKSAKNKTGISPK